jgi:DNA-binding response OmpR family regulator
MNCWGASSCEGGAAEQSEGNSGERSRSSSSFLKGKILLIASDLPQVTYLSDVLRRAGYSVAVASEVPAEPEMLLAPTRVAILFSARPYWPIERLCEICASFRRVAPTLPLIVIGPNDVMSKVRLFNLGADDYVVEPFDHTEFLARINSWARRST